MREKNFFFLVKNEKLLHTQTTYTLKGHMDKSYNVTALIQERYKLAVCYWWRNKEKIMNSTFQNHRTGTESWTYRRHCLNSPAWCDWLTRWTARGMGRPPSSFPETGISQCLEKLAGYRVSAAAASALSVSFPVIQQEACTVTYLHDNLHINHNLLF